MNINLFKRLVSYVAASSLFSMSIGAESVNDLVVNFGFSDSQSPLNRKFSVNSQSEDASFLKRNKNLIISSVVSALVGCGLGFSLGVSKSDLEKKLSILGFSENEKTWIKVLVGEVGVSLDVEKTNGMYRVSHSNFFSLPRIISGISGISDVDRYMENYPIMVFFPNYERTMSQGEAILRDLYLGVDLNKILAWRKLLEDAGIRLRICDGILKCAKKVLQGFMYIGYDYKDQRRHENILWREFQDYELKKITRILRALKIFSYEAGDPLDEFYNMVMDILKMKRESDRGIDRRFANAYDLYFLQTRDVPRIYGPLESIMPVLG